MSSLWEFLVEYQTHLIFAASVVLSVSAAVHIALTKRDVRAAIAWVGVVLFSPFLGPILYFIVGINRIRHTRIRSHRDRLLKEVADHTAVTVSDLARHAAPQCLSLKKASDTVTRFPLCGGNEIIPLNGGDQAYPAMLAAIDAATDSVVLQTYIFDNDIVGHRFADSLIAAFQRGVRVRILIDSIGVRYSHPTIVNRLRQQGVMVELFETNAVTWRMPYANMRCHRKILVVDGEYGFAGGMNIREEFLTEITRDETARDIHFQVRGPIVAQLLVIFCHDWLFSTGEQLKLSEWVAAEAAFMPADMAARCVPSGPDREIESTHKVLLAACAVAQQRIRIQSPYFLPDQVLIGALTTAARRGVQVDIVIPGRNNLRLVQYAMMAQIDQMIETGCRVWKGSGNFDHSKLMTVDDSWSLIGSSNWDSRSLRLNFEIDIEVYDRRLAGWINGAIDNEIAHGERLTVEALRKQGLLAILRNKLIWLATPYL
ncbi:cardiolipin synthase [Advenella mimigardefordensis]|uniref:Cardiolipin synthase n=1 Tax=Advenella mimigardefordensis (strain DSM 17166 / LMG 22922 / DPN7) TaxID=1247726 RepID=W0P8Z7_ADVMD|nr:cardiolipin synthase [Advenella mimigardefordensis]AHG63319.1 putative phospholipase [Advenella mimigardefordensis DPN7]